MIQKVFVLTQSTDAYDTRVYFAGVFSRLEAAQQRAERETQRKEAPLTEWRFDPNQGPGAWVMETQYESFGKRVLFWQITENDVEGLEPAQTSLGREPEVQT